MSAIDEVDEETRRAAGWRESLRRGICANHKQACDNPDTWVREINDYPDYEIKCFRCGYRYKVDGPDA